VIVEDVDVGRIGIMIVEDIVFVGSVGWDRDRGRHRVRVIGWVGS
jgi:hypothetical protein